MNGLMALPNRIGLNILSPLIVREIRAFFARLDWKVTADITDGTRWPRRENRHNRPRRDQLFAVHSFRGEARGSVQIGYERQGYRRVPSAELPVIALRLCALSVASSVSGTQTQIGQEGSGTPGPCDP